MAFREFTYPGVLDRLGLTVAHADLFPGVPPTAIRPDFADILTLGIRLCAATANEKARSEFLIAPVFMELQRRYPERFRLFSGVELSADPDNGLNGICDFVFTKGASAYVVTAPIVAIAEAKPDNVVTGFGQCIAGMRAAAIVNEQAGQPVPEIHGVSTTGTQWKFLRLVGTAVTIDRAEYFINQPEQILGILSHVIEIVTAVPGGQEVR